MRFVCVVVNFLVEPSLSYREITGLRQIHFLGENVSAAVGVLSSRIHLAEFSSVLLLLFLVDASIELVEAEHYRESSSCFGCGWKR